MLCRLICLTVVLANLKAGPKDTASLREQENALAKALASGDKISLRALTEDDFQVSLGCGSVAHSFSTTLSRENWIDYVSELRIGSYHAHLAGISAVDASTSANILPPVDETVAIVTVNESWTIHLPSGRTLERRLRAIDTWLKRQGTWKLANRMYVPAPCSADLYSGRALPL